MPAFYERYWGAGAKSLSDFELKWPILSKRIPAEGNITILDFGCGTGHIISEIARLNPSAKLIGVDVSRAALDTARKQAPPAEFFPIEDGAAFPLPDASVDFVFSSEVIEHVYDTENAVREIARVLKPGGKLLITTPYHGLLKNLALVLFSFDFHFSPTGAHIRFFTKRSLTNLLNQHGLQPREYGYYGRFYPLSHSIFVVAQKQ